ncbi:hypothetical protein NQG36_03720 [Exiguobacterium aquaticum]|nr:MULTISPECIES: hypothetical protein [Exiguobacterium]MCT4776355.1 hypothetical protein [Exiguobacterium aquaticum]
MPTLHKITSLSSQIDLYNLNNKKVGYFGVGETFARSSYLHTDQNYIKYSVIYAYTTEGFIPCYEEAYSSNKIGTSLAYGSKFAKRVISSSQLIFETRRQVRVYSGTTLIETLPTGSEIRTDGTSTSGATYPDRLYITGYRRAGATQWKYFSSNTWAETGIRAGYYTTPSIKN